MSGNGTTGYSVDDASRPPRIVFLALIMMVSLAGNVFVVYSSIHGKRCWGGLQTVAVINLVVTCFLDCLLNMSLVMGSLLAGDLWVFPDPVCR